MRSKAAGYLTLATGLRSASVGAKRVPPAHSTTKCLCRHGTWLIARRNNCKCGNPHHTHEHCKKCSNRFNCRDRNCSTVIFATVSYTSTAVWSCRYRNHMVLCTEKPSRRRDNRCHEISVRLAKRELQIFTNKICL